MPLPAAVARAAGTVVDHPEQSLLELALYISLVVGAALLLRLLAIVLWRERMLRRLRREHPDQARELTRAVRGVPLLGVPQLAPSDPYARTHDVTVAPLGDGRPGWSLRGPGPNLATGELGRDGSRQDARVLLTDGTHLLVVCLGRLGTVTDGHELRPAPERAHRFATEPPGGWHAHGPVDRVDGAIGTGWRVTASAGGPSVLTDTHVDRDGWAFVVGVLSSSWHARAVEALDAVLTTWTWQDDPA